MTVALPLLFSTGGRRLHGNGLLHAGKFYSWVSTLLPFLPQQFDENDDSELSESQMYVAEGQRVVNRALQRAEAGDASAVLLNNLAHYSPSQSVPTGALN